MMAHLAIIEDGKVVNRIIGEPGFAGGIECPREVGIGWAYDGVTFSPPLKEPRPITISDVIQERSHRLALGFDYDFGDGRGVHRIGTTDSDMEGWSEVTSWSNAAIALGDTTSTITISTDTGPANVTAIEWQQILLAATQSRQPIWQASFVLQTMDPIPNDYTDDKYWSNI